LKAEQGILLADQGIFRADQGNTFRERRRGLIFLRFSVWLKFRGGATFFGPILVGIELCDLDAARAVLEKEVAQFLTQTQNDLACLAVGH
jgi:hypothetical protein